MAGLHRKEKASSLRAPSMICRSRALSLCYVPLSRFSSLKYKPEEGTKGPLLQGLDISFEAANT